MKKAKLDGKESTASLQDAVLKSLNAHGIPLSTLRIQREVNEYTGKKYSRVEIETVLDAFKGKKVVSSTPKE
jgi:hypothetical protein